jgi:hypothetical protein
MRHQSDDFARREGIRVPRRRALPRLHPDFDQKPHVKRGNGWAQHPDDPALAIEQVIVANFSPPVIEKPSAPLKI